MASLISKPIHKIRTTILFIFFVLVLCSNISANDTNNADKAENKKPIHITSDQLFIDNNNREAEFVGNVVATQENTVINSDSLKIFYKKDTMKGGDITADEQSIQKIIARGNVRINFDNRLAEADQAVYTASSRILVLTGENSKITSENNSISGEKIILYRDDGRIYVESDQDKNAKNNQIKKRVEAVISSDGNGLN